MKKLLNVLAKFSSNSLAEVRKVATLQDYEDALSEHRFADSIKVEYPVNPLEPTKSELDLARSIS